MRRWLAGTFAALGVRDFRILWLGTILSFVAFFMSTVVQSVVAFELSGTNRAVGAVLFAQGIAMAILGPLGGALADRWPKRRVVATGQIAAAAVFGSLAWLMATGSIRLAFLAAGSLVMGATFAFLGPARQAMIIDLVPAERRGNAMAINNIANTGSRVLGPALAGLMLAWPLSGATGAYATMGLFYVASAASIALLPRSRVRPDARARPVFADMTDGFRYVWAHRRLRLVVLFFISVMLTGFPHVTVLPGLLEHALGTPAEAVSRLYLAAAVGALAASIAVARSADSQGASGLYVAMALGFGLSLAALAWAPSFGLAALAMLGVGAASGGFQALNAAVIARECEPRFFGRVMSLTLLAFAGFGLMALPAGALADAIGERATLLVMGCAVLVLGVGFGAALARDARTVAGD